MRQIVLDTETTGLSTAQGHRIIEIGCIEMVNRRLTGSEFHRFLNPDRDIDEGAVAVHGISRAQLETEPRFHEIVDEFLDFVKDAELVIHNADFDVGFLDHELKLMKHVKPRIADHCQVLDTLSLARKIHPGQRNSLDALCKRYEVDNSSRTLHGALLDAEILADVYLAMTGGQSDLGLSFEAPAATDLEPGQDLPAERPPLQVLLPSDAEIAAHEARLHAIHEKSGHCLWKDL